MGYAAAGGDVLFACVDFLEDIDLILDVFKCGIVGQTIQQLLEKLLGRHGTIQTQLEWNWYARQELNLTAASPCLVVYQVYQSIGSLFCQRLRQWQIN